MDKRSLLEKRREEILQEMRGIRGMRKGSVMEQYLKVSQKGKKPALRGPYWLYTHKRKGKSVGRRLGVEEAKWYREEVEAYHRFQVLCHEYCDLTQRLGVLEHELAEGSVEKKRLKSRSKGTGK